MNQPRIYPHRERRSAINFIIALFIIIIIVVACSCSPQYGCAYTSGKNFKVGYHPNR